MNLPPNSSTGALAIILINLFALPLTAPIPPAELTQSETVRTRSC